MILATDVHYDDAGAWARGAALAFSDWPDAEPVAEYVELTTEFDAYRPGAFFRRELPCVLPVVRQALAEHPLRCVVIDGYVDLDRRQAGLGRHLHAALQRLGCPAAVVGVAKSPFFGARAVEVHRGRSARPLYVSAVGYEPTSAALAVAGMHGPHRIPTLLRRVDHLARALR